MVQVAERLDERLARAGAGRPSARVKDSDELRKAYAAAQDRIVEFTTALGQNRELYAAVKAVADSADFAALPRAARTLVEHELRDFELSGVALEEPARTRYREISSELAQLSTAFEEAVLDATDAWSEHLPEESALAGIPASGRDVLRAAAQEKELDGWLVTLKQPSVQAVLTYADDRALRARVYRAYGTRASENSQEGRHDNSARIERIMALRHEAARLLGFANTAEESLATKMAPSADTVIAFLRDLVAKARPMAERDLAELRAFARSELGLAELEPGHRLCLGKAAHGPLRARRGGTEAVLPAAGGHGRAVRHRPSRARGRLAPATRSTPGMPTRATTTSSMPTGACSPAPMSTCTHAPARGGA